MERSGYDSDMSDKEWENIQKYLPAPSTRGAHLRKWDQRVIINAILYVVTAGCQCRMLPNDYPPWQSVYYHYNNTTTISGARMKRGFSFTSFCINRLG